MDPHISEFSFGYAATSELITLFHLKSVGAPEFATQNKEGKPGGGVGFETPTLPVFLQFKRAYRMVRGAAQESSHFSDLPFFRMYLHQRNQSDQQKLLMKLDTGANVVRYVAPAFGRPIRTERCFFDRRCLTALNICAAVEDRASQG